ncbi:unnamed protein product [Porites evermanni]|uniref:Uncharacterized protein n=1 Tax=Porites evermanni TaxID=104178 RepID=A0ABN8LNF9_9CNID|nr:unnamed protein product [Porites evermanni]
MSFESDTEQSDVESIGSRTHICETKLGSDEDEEDMYYSDPEGPYIDEPIADEEWLTEYNRELEEIERRNQELQNCFDRIYLLFLPKRQLQLQHSHQVEEEQGIALFAKDS